MTALIQDRLDAVRAGIREFVAARNWAQFHDPKNLAMAIASEAGELLAELRWVANAEADNVVRDTAHRSAIEQEVADIAISLLLFCDRADIDLISAIERKLEINATNYPVAASRGKSHRPATPQPGGFGKAIAVDWSGHAGGGRDTIWVAVVEDGSLIRLENGRSRDEVTSHLIEMARSEPNIVVGLDFAFAFPRWFAESRGITTIDGLWAAAATEGETWLKECRSPFWGRPGTTKPSLPAHFRATESNVAGRQGSQPKSVFQIGGAGAVGTGSIRGMPHLRRLRAAGFSIWPFDPPRPPLVVEIYPRLLTGAVVKSDQSARTSYLAAHTHGLDDSSRLRAALSEDAFDAAVSALAMWEHRKDISSLTSVSDEAAALEGRIWYPESK
jgi:NTP pyrophosphatase (non-canonical NTP hydrolase)